jgi:hypothetical protein
MSEIEPLMLLLDVLRRQEMVMHVDPSAGRGLDRRRLRERAARRNHARRGETLEELPAGEATAAMRSSTVGR